ncbi:putative E3 ubiquitin ligase complex SCF subunit sconC [Rosellinia necatrix]|uniref:E3 ubiquitin ligase complex SCF subunit n=1 Tax=Rosellinia necatrix TaxID=77044 RepID=A0A1W2TE72_ROSNE|nr:putative E3 ubiquitin ligase complex SCF subunit sconC [Rosellinia necatrix]
MSTTPMVTLIGRDSVEVQATLQAVKKSVTIDTMLTVLDEEKTTGMPIPVPGVPGDILKKVMEFCEHHLEDKPEDEGAEDDDEAIWDSEKIPELSEWDAAYLDVDKDTLFQIANAANYLEIPLLLKYAVNMVASRLVGKTTEEMREFLNIESDFTPEEEQEIRKNNEWVMRQPDRAT